MGDKYSRSEEETPGLNSQKRWNKYLVMQFFQKLDKFFMLEGLVPILAKEVLH